MKEASNSVHGIRTTQAHIASENKWKLTLGIVLREVFVWENFFVGNVIHGGPNKIVENVNLDAV